MKKYLILLLTLMLILTSCSKPAAQLTITEQEKSEGYFLMQEYGIKFKFPPELLTHLDNLTQDELIPEDKDNPIERQYLMKFVSQEMLDVFYEILTDANLSEIEKRLKVQTDIMANLKPVFAFTVIKKEKMPKDKAALPAITGHSINQEIGRTKKYVQFFSTAEPNNTGLSEASASTYAAILKEAQNITKHITTGDPLIVKEGLADIKNLKFQSQDLDGNPIDQTIFKEAKLTMINVWATWCGPCRAEIPDLGQVAKAYKDKGVQIIGFLSDSNLDKEGMTKDQLAAKDLEVPNLAKKILDDAGAEYLNIKISPLVKEQVMSHITAVPTTFFVDSEGNAVGTVLLGAQSEQQFAQAIDNALKALEGK